jgi:NADP-dependent 3-hydroxy acid dehydrogenase YdfG
LKRIIAVEELAMEEISSVRNYSILLPIMRKQKSGIIMNISSEVGRFGVPGESSYVSTKFESESKQVA